MKGCQKDVERESLGVQSLVGVEGEGRLKDFPFPFENLWKNRCLFM